MRLNVFHVNRTFWGSLDLNYTYNDFSQIICRQILKFSQLKHRIIMTFEDHNKDFEFLVVFDTDIVVAIVAVILRMWIRAQIIRKIKIDDWIVLVFIISSHSASSLISYTMIMRSYAEICDCVRYLSLNHSAAWLRQCIMIWENMQNSWLRSKRRTLWKFFELNSVSHSLLRSQQRSSSSLCSCVLLQASNESDSSSSWSSWWLW